MSDSERQDKILNIRALLQETEEKSSDDDYIYRGEPEHYEEVSSSLYRQYRDIDQGRDIYVQPFNIEVVQKEILDKAKEYTQESDEFEILAELQHHGGKTNLIDFTTDYRIALFFACDGFHDKDGRLILQRREAIRDQIKRPQNPVNRVIAQKSVFV